MFSYNYLSEKHLKGFQNYKYSALDTSPLSRYVMHPTWDALVQYLPKWLAPNLITFAGFLCMVINVMILLVYDYECTASGRAGLHAGTHAGSAPDDGTGIPGYVLVICGLLVFLAYNLDGLDGKQARRLGVSGPLGEMFDHGLDSYIVFLIPFCLFSIFGRDDYSVSVFRGYLMVLSIVLNFYVSHWEKYNTGILYLPWSYDLSMWVSSLLFVVAGVSGPQVFKLYVYGDVTFVSALEVTIHVTGLLTTLPVAIYNVYVSYKTGKCKTNSLLEALRPVWPMTVTTVAMTTWAWLSPTNVIERDPRAFLLLFGTIFSNIASRLIVAEMSEQRSDVFSWLNLPLVASVALSIWCPTIELTILYVFLLLALCAHLHYGICVVRQMCDHFGVKCFIVTRAKTK